MWAHRVWGVRYRGVGICIVGLWGHKAWGGGVVESGVGMVVWNVGHGGVELSGMGAWGYSGRED